MATETELERMVVRLVGDSSSYMKMLQEAQTAATAMAQVEHQLTIAEKERDAVMAKGAAITAQVQTASERYTAQIFELNSLLARGAITQETYGRAVQRAGQAYRDASGETARLAKIKADAQRQLMEAQQREQALMARGAAITASVMTASERYSSQLNELRRLYDQGYLGQETYTRAVKQAEATLRQSSSSLLQFGNSLSQVGMAATTLGASLTALSGGFATLGVMSAGKFEQTTIAFETMLGSAAETQKLLADLTEFAAKTPFEMPEVEQAARGLVAFGERGDKLIETLHILGNAAAGTSTDFGLLTLVYNQVRGVGKLLTQDFRQLSTRGVLTLKDIANYFKVTDEEAQDLLSTGQVGFEDLRNILASLSEEGGRFFNLTERQSDSLLGSIAKLKDAFNIFLRQIGEELIPIVKASTNTVLYFVEALSNLPKPLKVFLAVGASVVAVAGTLTTAFGAAMWAVGGLMSAVATFKMVIMPYIAKVQLAALATGGWAAAVLAAAAALSYGIYRYVGQIGQLNAAMEEGKRLSKELQDRYSKGTSSILEKASGMTDANKKAYLSAEIEKAQRQVEEYSKGVQAAQRRADEMAPTWKSLWQWGSKTWEVQKGVVDELSGLYSKAKERVSALSDELAKLKEDAQMKEARKGLAEYVEKLKESIAVAGMSKGEADLYKATGGLLPETELAEARALIAQQAAIDAAKDLNEFIDETIQKLKEEAETADMTASELIAYKMAKKAASLGMDMPQEVIDQAVRAQEAADRAKEAADARKALIEEQKKLKTDTDNLTKSLEEQIATFGMSSTEAAIYKLRLRGVSEEELKAAKIAARKLDAIQKEQKLIDRGKELTEQYLTPAQKLANTQKELDELLRGGHIGIDTYTRALEDAYDQVNKDYTVNFGVTGVDAVAAGSLEALSRFEEYRAGIKLPTLNSQVAATLAMMRPTENKTAADKRDTGIQEKMAGALETIVSLMTKQVETPHIILQPANFKGA